MIDDGNNKDNICQCMKLLMGRALSRRTKKAPQKAHESNNISINMLISFLYNRETFNNGNLIEKVFIIIISRQQVISYVKFLKRKEYMIHKNIVTKL